MSEQQTVEQIAEQWKSLAVALTSDYRVRLMRDDAVKARVLQQCADELLSALSSVRRQEEEKTDGLRACQSVPVREPEATPEER